MTIFKLFIDFINEILDFEILGQDLFNWLLTLTILIFVFIIIYELAGNKRNKQKDNEKGKKK